MSTSGLAYLTFCLLFIANAYPSLAQSGGGGGGAGAGAGADEAAPEGTLLVTEQPLPVVYYSVHRNLTLRCSLPVDKGVRPVWKKNGTEVEKLSDLSGRYEVREDGLVFNLTRPSTEDDFGNYSCGAAAGGQAWDVRARPYAKLDANTNVVEGQKLKLRCRVVGKPYPRVSWLYSNSSGGDDEEAAAAALNGSDVRAALGARVALRASDAGVPDGELVLEPAALADAGRYACVVSDSAALNAVTTVRVKDKYAALWPFLGICAEVFVLCAIILVYEKRRTKPELDDSDTDNHDQKKS